MNDIEIIKWLVIGLSCGVFIGWILALDENKTNTPDDNDHLNRAG
jgi:hypothetical protein